MTATNGDVLAMVGIIEGCVANLNSESLSEACCMLTSYAVTHKENAALIRWLPQKQCAERGSIDPCTRYDA